MLLPNLRRQNRKWIAVMPEHLRRTDILAIKTMQSHLQEVLQDTELMRMHMEEEEPEEEPMEEPEQ